MCVHIDPQSSSFTKLFHQQSLYKGRLSIIFTFSKWVHPLKIALCIAGVSLSSPSWSWKVVAALYIASHDFLSTCHMFGTFNVVVQFGKLLKICPMC